MALKSSNIQKEFFYLASQSPQRIRLLKDEGYTFEVLPSYVQEPPPLKETPADYVKNTAKLKALKVASSLKSGLVVGADTVVASQGAILGKPKNREEAFFMIHSLQDTTHQVWTGLCFVEAPSHVIQNKVVCTLIKMGPLEEKEIQDYLNNVSYMGKAGACDIEKISFAKIVEGSFSNVVGMPLEVFQETFEDYLNLKKRS